MNNIVGWKTKKVLSRIFKTPIAKAIVLLCIVILFAVFSIIFPQQAPIFVITGFFLAYWFALWMTKEL